MEYEAPSLKTKDLIKYCLVRATEWGGRTSKRQWCDNV